MAVRADDEMSKLVSTATISEGGVMKNVSGYLFPDKKNKKKI